jgi:hypothetical protein
VEYKSALTNATWNLLTNIVGSGAVTSVTDTAISATRFYRVATQ